MVIIFTLYSRQNNEDLENIKLINISIMLLYYIIVYKV